MRLEQLERMDLGKARCDFRHRCKLKAFGNATKRYERRNGYRILKFRRSCRGFVAPVRTEISTYTKIREIRTATKGCPLFRGTVTRRKLLLSYLHVESRHNETHVVTVDAASGADLLSRTRFPGRRSKRRRKRSGRRERGETHGRMGKEDRFVRSRL